MLKQMFDYPNINPIAIDIGIIKIRWYAISYICGILLSWFLILKIIRIESIKISYQSVSDLVSNCMIGIILGGRLGYVIFYNPEYYMNNILEIIKIWNGGMSFHGGFMGVVIAVIYTSKSHKVPIMLFSDLISIVSPIGIFFGRIANFINGELYGKITNHKFGMIFPKGGNLPRHPSQIYEAFFEGLLLFIILWLLMNMLNAFNKKGLMTASFIFLYGVFRFFVEFFREPDLHIGYLYFNLSMGQLLSLPMIIIGLYLLNKFYKKSEI
tara:strand:+ start:116 stop:919 length:804 start_codon:yes stop_codon:yes gene_type:complete